MQGFLRRLALRRERSALEEAYRVCLEEARALHHDDETSDLAKKKTAKAEKLRQQLDALDALCEEEDSSSHDV